MMSCASAPRQMLAIEWGCVGQAGVTKLLRCCAVQITNAQRTIAHALKSASTLDDIRSVHMRHASSFVLSVSSTLSPSFACETGEETCSAGIRARQEAAGSNHPDKGRQRAIYYSRVVNWCRRWKCTTTSSLARLG